jgi:queuine tRNA-ribosyltransferase
MACRRSISRDALVSPPPPEGFPAWQPGFFHHELLHLSTREGSRARVGRLHTPHGTVETPGFVVVGTNGAVKFVDHRAADDAGMELMFSNTLHLLVHPGADAIEAAGGLHRLIGREHRPLITDSGGFQILSFANRGQPVLPGREVVLGDGAPRSTAADEGADGHGGGEIKSSRPDAARLRYASEATSSCVRVTERGAHFRSYRDGSPIFLSPESVVAAQKKIGADIIIPLDDLPSASTSRSELVASVARTHRWEARSLMAHLDDPRQQAMYGVVHGGLDRSLRAESIGYLSKLPFDGYAIGGSLGRDRHDMLELLQYLMPLLPADKPNHRACLPDRQIASTLLSPDV